MISMLKSWEGSVDINGEHYENISDFISTQKPLSGDIHIKLYSNSKTPAPEAQAISESGYTIGAEYKISVKQYMTKTASPEFDFMAKWNNDNPMPLRTMTGILEKETPGMVYMRCHGVGEPTITCMRCGRELTNPISRKYGIGPECMSKIGFAWDIEEVDEIKAGLQNLEWSGWIIKSAITKKEVIR